MTEVSIGSCKHFLKYKEKFGVRSFTLVHGCFSACVSKEARKRKALSCLCFICGSSGPQLYSCLHCIFFGCKGAHINEHLRNSIHSIALELSYGTLYCYECDDFIYDKDFLKISEDHLHLEAKSLNRQLPWRPWIPNQQEENILLANPRITSFNSAGLRGLINLGATCFMNCIVQVLVHTPLLRDYFCNQTKPLQITSCNNSINSNRECIVCEFQRIFQEFYSCPKRDPLPLDHLLYVVWSHAKHLAGYAHKDAHEFLIAVLDLLHTHKHKNQSKAAQQNDSDNNDPTQCDCIICKIFTGRLQSDVVCTECHGVSTTIDPFWDISLDLGEAQTGVNGPPMTPRTLIDCLERYTRAENLGAAAKIKCSNCKRYQESTKKLSMKTLPIVASFHLKRFEYSSHNMKKATYISFPKELDMTPFMSQKQDGYQGDYRYLLYAVVNHTGTTEFGHYTSYIRHIKDVWVKCNDEKIALATIEQVLDSEGYLLFYHKKKLEYDT